MRRSGLVCMMVAMATTAAAEPKFELAVAAGYQWGNGIVLEENAIRNDDFAIDSSVMGVSNLKIGYGLSNKAKLEFLYARHDTQLQDKDSLFGTKPGGFFDAPVYEDGEVVKGANTHMLDLTTQYYHLGFLYEFNEGPTRAFATASAGVTRLEFNLPLPSDTRFSASLGVGAKQDLSRWLGLRLEGRYYYTDTDETVSASQDFSDQNNPSCSEPCTYTYRYDDNLVHGEVTLGFILKPF